MAKIASEMAVFAGDWLMEHIMVMDKKYEAFMNEAGLK